MTRRATSRRLCAGSLLATTSLLATGCIHVGHGPRIEPGTRWFVNGGFGYSPDTHRDAGTRFLPTLVMGGSHGWVSDAGTAISLGAQLPPLGLPITLWDEPLRRLFDLVLFDAYLQPRRGTRGIDVGIGALASTGLLMPYLQAGSPGDGGVFTTQGVAFTHGSLSDAWYWLPSVSFRSLRPDGERIVDFYVGAMVAHWNTSTEPRTSVTALAGFVATFQPGF